MTLAIDVETREKRRQNRRALVLSHEVLSAVEQQRQIRVSPWSSLSSRPLPRGPQSIADEKGNEAEAEQNASHREMSAGGSENVHKVIRQRGNPESCGNAG